MEPPPFCVVCQSKCTADVVRSPDIVGGGYPCQPHSRFRQTSGQTARTKRAQDHPAFNTLMVDFPKYLEHFRPKSFFVEEVDGIMRQTCDGGSFLDTLMESLSDLGYATRALLLDHGVWCKMPRRRVFLVGFSPEVGGAQAAAWFQNAAEQVTKTRSRSPPTCIWDIVPPSDPTELEHISQNKAGGCHGRICGVRSYFLISGLPFPGPNTGATQN